MSTKTDETIRKMLVLIESGDWYPGRRLERLPELTRAFGVSVATVRSAIDRLVGSGHLFKTGNSWYVDRRIRDRRQPYRYR
jgi:DNA-binding GntR family transcriptional regulator